MKHTVMDFNFGQCLYGPMNQDEPGFSILLLEISSSTYEQEDFIQFSLKPPKSVFLSSVKLRK